ncbi:MAG: Ig-like domain-containing protein [Mariprofundaceae bacterium]
MLITPVGAAGTSQIAVNDPNFLDTHTYAISTMPANGTASVDSYGLATYTPNAAYVGADSFVVTVTDNTGLSSVVSINVTIASFPTIGLLAHYPFDGYANDVSGNVRNGTVFGGVTYPAGVSGQAASFHNVNNASFFTVNDYMQLPNITLNTSFAFSYSVLFRSDAHIHNASIYSIGDNSNGLFFAHFLTLSG